MRKILAGLLVAFISASAFGQLTKIGAGLGYNSGYWFNLDEHGDKYDDHKIGNPLFSLTGIYEVNLPIHIKPSLNIYFPNITKFEEFNMSEKRTVSAFSLDVDAHYVFNYLDKFELYGLAGLNILYVKMKYKYDFDGFSGTDGSSNTALGANLGLGSYIKMREQFDLFVELKAVLSKQIQFVGTAGILINIQWLKENENNEL